jgi:hypothetical protein
LSGRYAAALLALVGCSSEVHLEHRDVLDHEPVTSMAVHPSGLGFDTLAKGETSELSTVTLTNDGETPWELTEVVIAGPTSFQLHGSSAPMRFEPGISMDFQVGFSALDPGATAAILRFTTDEAGKARVDLEGAGALPEVALDPLDLGTAAVLCGAVEGSSLLANTGQHDLAVNDIWLDTDDLQLTAVDLPDTPLVLGPGEQAELTARYLPQVTGAAVGWWRVRAPDAEGGPVHSARVSGLGEHALSPLTEEFEVGRRTIDLLLAVDRSASMDEDNPSIHAAFLNLVDHLQDLNPSFQVGVVTGFSACFNGGIITPDTPDYGPAIIDAMQGPGSDLTETLLALARDALDATADCNAGFLRADTPLQLVVISDEAEQSEEGWEALVDELQGHPERPELLHVSGVVDLIGTCGEGAAGYIEAAEATDGVLVDLCEPATLDDGVLQLLEPSQMGVDLFALAELPAIETLEVSIDGEVTLGWTYDGARQAVRLDPAPAPGQTVSVHYTPSGCP